MVGIVGNVSFRAVIALIGDVVRAVADVGLVSVNPTLSSLC